MHVHRAGVAHVIVLPHRFQHGFPAEHLAPVGDEQLQQIKFLGRQADFLAAQGDGTVHDVHFHIVHPDDLLFFPGGGLGRAAQHRLDPGLHLQDVEGLGHVIVRAVFQAQDLIHILALGGEHQDGHVAALPDALAHLDAVQLGQHHVQQHQVHLLLEKNLQCLLAVRGGEDLIPFLFQRKAKPL